MRSRVHAQGGLPWLRTGLHGWLRWFCAGVLLALAAWPAQAQLGRASSLPDADTPGARVIVGYRSGAALLREHPVDSAAGRRAARAVLQRRADALARHVGVVLRTGRGVGPRAQVLRAAGLSSQALAQRLSDHPDVAWAVVDRRVRGQAAPDDPLFSAGPPVVAGQGGPVVGQWYLRAPDETFRSAINAQAGWARTTGQGVVVAVLDTGVRFDHPDLHGRLLPGYDMVLEAGAANDGDGRDTDASDPGDGITAQEANTVGGEFYGGFPRGCTEQDSITGDYLAQDSSWHGTEVAGLIAAAANNGIGIAGAAHGARVLPVRVLGKCGGYDSDIQAGIYWAAGIEQGGLRGSTTPARVINLSLGGTGACSTAYQQAISTVIAQGVVVVAAAGNSTGRSVGTPANCSGVIAVAGLRHAGTKVGFSDLGPQIAIAAPGGNCVSEKAGEPCLYPLLTTTNLGLFGPGPNGYSDSFRITVGTSFATPLVSATAAMVLALRPEWGATEVRQILQSSARPFPPVSSDPKVATCHAPDFRNQLECHCTTALCGAGMLDVDAALQQAAPSGSSGGGAFGWGWGCALALAGVASMFSRASPRAGRRPFRPTVSQSPAASSGVGPSAGTAPRPASHPREGA